MLEGTTTLVSAAAPALGARIATGLGELGATVGTLAGSAASREEAIASVTAAATELGSLDAVVHVAGVAGGPVDRLLVDTDEDGWDADAEAPIREALYVMQGAHAAFDGGGGSIVAVLPMIAITGAAGLVPFAAAAEGIRQLVKSAARDWGDEGVRVNCVALPLEDWGFEPPPGHQIPNRYGPSLAGANGGADLAGAVGMLVSELSVGLNGGTLGVDRGTVMAP
ncbi:MAG: SDR family oxidoreductase [Actinobacteria bacterium]|nr:SDR family oxidoreductase [Actinomycetota bacterium]